MTPKPLVLLASTEKSQLRALEKEFASGGYSVVTANAERAVVEQAQNQKPHAIVLDVGVAPPGYGLARTLRTDPAVSPATPIVLTRPGKPTRTQQIEAWRAGAWDLREEPFDSEDFLARLNDRGRGLLAFASDRTLKRGPGESLCLGTVQCRAQA